MPYIAMAWHGMTCNAMQCNLQYNNNNTILLKGFFRTSLQKSIITKIKIKLTVHDFVTFFVVVVLSLPFSADTSVQSPLATKAKKEQWSTWSIKGGIQTLSDKLHEDLKQKGVNFKLNTPCTSVDFDPHGKLIVSWPKDQITVDHVISGLPAQTLANILPQDWQPLAVELANIQTVTVGIVNLEYEGSVVPVEGFGFLVPSSDTIQVLGIIFDSCAFPENDRLGGKTTRITVSFSL